MLIDTHVHLDSFTTIEIKNILQRSSDVGVDMVISAGTTIATSIDSIAHSNLFPGFFTGVGVHPMDINQPMKESDYSTLYELASSSEKTLVISEIGLDYLPGMPDRAWQFESFRKQINIATDLGLPIVFHSREAHKDCFRVLKEEKAYEVGGIMHYFQGDVYDAETSIASGFLISIAKPLFRLPQLQKVVSEIPLTNIVIETDSAPQPFKKNRDNWTEPRHLKSIIDKIAELKKMDILEVEQTILMNTKKILSKKWDVVRKYIDVD